MRSAVLLCLLLAMGTLGKPHILEQIPLFHNSSVIHAVVRPADAHRLYVAFSSEGEDGWIQAFDTSNPAAVRSVAVSPNRTESCGRCSGCFSRLSAGDDDERLYAAGCSGVWALDRTTLDVVARTKRLGDIYGLYVHGGMVYVTLWSSVLVLSATDLSEVRTLPFSTGPLLANGDVLYTLPAAADPPVLEVLSIPDYSPKYKVPVEAVRMELHGSILYCYSSGGLLSVFNVSDTSVQPMPLSTHSSAFCSQVEGLVYSQGKLYVPDDYCGVQIVDVSNPARPELASPLTTPGAAKAFEVQDNFGFVGVFTALYSASLK